MALLEEKMLFAEHLALMIKGGIPLADALNTLKTEARNRAFKKTLEQILKRILEGESLSKAMERHPKIFDKFSQDIVRIGEESGTLEENLKYLALKLRKDYEMQKKVRGALIYPAIILVMALVIALTVTFFILPKITNLFQLLEIELPLATKILISTVSFFQKYLIFVFFGIILIILVFKALLRLNLVKFCLDRASLSLPLFGQIFKNLNLAFFSRTFYTLLKGGVPLIETLEISAKTQPNEVYKQNLIRVRAEVERGEKISQGLKIFPKTFPSVFSEMVLVGEKAGTLEESLLYLAEYHEKEMDSTLKNLSGIIEPVLLILVGILVAFVAIAIIIPIYRFTGQLRFR